jgi:hypothetical protein
MTGQREEERKRGLKGVMIVQHHWGRQDNSHPG